jgi:hypothetical protein
MEKVDRADAIRIRALALTAIESLAEALEIADPTGAPEFVAAIKRGVGISIGTIDAELLSVVYMAHADLDHLK